VCVRVYIHKTFASSCAKENISNRLNQSTLAVF